MDIISGWYGRKKSHTNNHHISLEILSNPSLRTDHLRKAKQKRMTTMTKTMMTRLKGVGGVVEQGPRSWREPGVSHRMVGHEVPAMPSSAAVGLPLVAELAAFASSSAFAWYFDLLIDHLHLDQHFEPMLKLHW